MNIYSFMKAFMCRLQIVDPEARNLTRQGSALCSARTRQKRDEPIKKPP